MYTSRITRIQIKRLSIYLECSYVLLPENLVKYTAMTFGERVLITTM